MDLINSGLDLAKGILAGIKAQWCGPLTVLVVGSIIAVIVRRIVTMALEAIRFGKIAKSKPIANLLSRGGVKSGLGELIASGLFYLIISATLILSLEQAGVGGVRTLAGALLAFLPRVAVALLIGFFGVLVAEIASGVVKVIVGNMGLSRRDLWGTLTQYAVLIFTAIVALRQLGVFQWISPLGRDLIVGAIALAFGLAGKESASNVIDSVSGGFSDDKVQR
tara:strand:- start:130 stop:795 length:666 start_codon:yes stop_codon:yes gene_type:complete